jgi:hypothetical protein
MRMLLLAFGILLLLAPAARAGEVPLTLGQKVPDQSEAGTVDAATTKIVRGSAEFYSPRQEHQPRSRLQGRGAGRGRPLHDAPSQGASRRLGRPSQGGVARDQAAHHGSLGRAKRAFGQEHPLRGPGRISRPPTKTTKNSATSPGSPWRRASIGSGMRTRPTSTPPFRDRHPPPAPMTSRRGST